MSLSMGAFNICLFEIIAVSLDVQNCGHLHSDFNIHVLHNFLKKEVITPPPPPHKSEGVCTPGDPSVSLMQAPPVSSAYFSSVPDS